MACLSSCSQTTTDAPLPEATKPARSASRWAITNASQLAKLDANTVRLSWSVVLERTVRELQGTACLEFEDEPAPRQQIASTRSFGSPVRELEPLIQAIMTCSGFPRQ